MTSSEETEADRLSRHLESLAQFAAGAGHELNNPLANISGRAQSLLRDETQPERRRQLAAIVAQAERAHRMIVDLMLFARPSQPQRAEIDLRELVLAAVSKDQPEATQRGIELTTVTPENPVLASVDRVQIAALLSALLRNSLDALAESGRIEVALQSGATEILLTVMDTGPGLHDEALRHAFDPFYSGRQSGRGLGFGLCKCYRIAQLHGGSISLENGPTGGAIATLRLPNELNR